MKATSLVRLSTLASCALLSAHLAHAQAVIYEGFDYSAGIAIVGQGGSTDGWDGAWSGSGGTNLPETTAGLTFGDLQETGLAAVRPTRAGNGAMSRPVSAASQAALTADGSTAWFSVLMTPTGGDGFAANSFGTLIFGDAPLTGGSGFSAAPIQAGGNGVGVSFAGAGGPDFGNMQMQAVAYDAGTLTQQSPTTVGAGTTLIVGRVDWAATGTDDVLNLYIVSDPSVPLGAPFATINVDLPQSGFDQISIGDSQTSIFDEIRFGPILGDVLPLGTPPPPPVSDGPNIIYIIVDDMGYSDLGCYGGEIDTPNIDRIATEGIKFRQFYNDAKCEPSRTALMTGLYHSRGGETVGRGNTNAGATLAEALKSTGYQTYAVGKWHLGTGAGIPTLQGFDNFYGFYAGFADYFPSGIGTNTIKRDAAIAGNLISAYPDSSFNASNGTSSSQNSFPADYYITDGFGDNTQAFIDDAVNNHGDNPFFIYLAFNAPHTPLQAQVPLIDKYRNNGTYDDGWDVLRQEKWQRQLALGITDPAWQLSNLRDDIPAWDSLTAAEQAAEVHRRSVYAAMMESVDINVGKVLDSLDAAGIADDTLIIFTGDNGAQAFDNTNDRSVSPSDPDSRWSMGPAWASVSNTPFRYYKQSQHQGGICTPFVARWPGTIAPGIMTDQPGHLVDMMATFVDIADADYSSLTKDNGDPVPPMDGASLMPIFEGGTRPAPDFWGFSFSNSEFGVIKDDWKLVAFSSSPWRLYNLKDDRTETNNLRWENPAKVTELAVLYDQWAIDTYGDTSATYAERDTRSQLTQNLRYLRVLNGGVISVPGGVHVDHNGINAGGNVSMNDQYEFYDTNARGTGIGTNNDSFTFASRHFCGDGQLIAQVELVEDMTADGFAGVMFRESIADDSAMIMIGVNDGGDLLLSTRATSGVTALTSVEATGITLPVFLKIDRTEGQFTPCYSTDGITWIEIAATAIDFPIDIRAGLASASGTTGSQADVVFREWDSLDLAAYPLRTHRSDGLPQYLAYALGISAGESPAAALPDFDIVDAAGLLYPEIRFNHRIGIPASQFAISWHGEDLVMRQDDSANWSILNVTPNPGGISESVLMRRSQAIGPPRSFFSLEVGK